MRIKLHRSFGLFIIFSIIALGGCSTNPATGDQSFTGFMSQEDEIKIGREEHPKITKSFGGVYNDPVLTDYVVGLGNRLAAKSELPNIKWTFTVLNSPQINAFALPGGYVYVTRGLMSLASNEAELAGVIAHEIGHVTGRHSAQRYSRAVGASIFGNIIGVAEQVLVGTNLSGNLVNVGAGLYLQGFSREQEFEADLLGVRYLSRSAYNTSAMASFLSKLRAHSKLEAKRHEKDPSSVDQGDMFATHPRTIDRVERAIANANKSTTGTRVGSVDYLERLHNILYGDDPKEGFVKGLTFVHPDLQFRFDVPKGFRLINGSTAVHAKGPGGSIIQFDMAPKPYNGDMKAYIVNQWAKKGNWSRVERLNVNGMAGATATTRIRQSNKTFDLRFVAIRQRADRIYRFAFLTPPNLTSQLSVPLRKTTFSLRNISRSEAQKFQPSRILVKPVKAGDTVQTFVQQMGVDQLPEETFRVINGLGPRDQLRVGQLVKVISG